MDVERCCLVSLWAQGSFSCNFTFWSAIRNSFCHHQMWLPTWMFVFYSEEAASEFSHFKFLWHQSYRYMAWKILIGKPLILVDSFLHFDGNRNVCCRSLGYEICMFGNFQFWFENSHHSGKKTELFCQFGKTDCFPLFRKWSFIL